MRQWLCDACLPAGTEIKTIGVLGDKQCDNCGVPTRNINLVCKPTMLDVLADTVKRLKYLVADPLESWNSLDVDYEPPRVERLWRSVGENRVYLHKIHPCETALFHPHPWPSAVLILSGKYEMRVGYFSGSDSGGARVYPPTAATVILTEGSSYEMVTPDGWHSVRPLDRPSLSVMVTGRPWPKKDYQPGKDRDLKALEPDAQRALLQEFKDVLSRAGHT